MAMPMERPTILASASGELNTRCEPNLRCKPAVALKTPPFPFTVARLSSRLQSATSSPKTTMRSSRFISSSRVMETISTIVFGWPLFSAWIEIARGRIHIGRINPFVNRIRRRKFRGQGAIGGFDDFAVHFGFQGFDFTFFQDAFAHQEQREFGQRIALRVGGAFRLALVKLFIVGKRVRVRTDDVRVDQRRTFARAAMFGGTAQRGITIQRLRAVAFLDVQVRDSF